MTSSFATVIQDAMEQLDNRFKIRNLANDPGVQGIKITCNSRDELVFFSQGNKHGS